MNKSIEDKGKVQMGNKSPAFRVEPAAVADKGNVRMGNKSPAFRPG